MRNTHDESGTTLIEALVAAALLTTLAGGTATLILTGHRLGLQAEQSLVATSLARSRLARLLAVPWQYQPGGGVPPVPALALAPDDALDLSVSGFSEITDRAGRMEGSPESDGPQFVVRWAVWPLTTGPSEGRALEVCVFAWPAGAGAVPLACLASARVRQP